MLNFRKLKHDFSPSMLKEGKVLYEKDLVASVKIVDLNTETIRFSCSVQGGFDNSYQCKIEINRNESTIRDSECNCAYKYDCQHLAAVLFYLETHADEIIVTYSKETDLEKVEDVDDHQKQHLRETFKEAESKEHVRQGKKYQKELLEEYIHASQVLGQSSFFCSEEKLVPDKAELAVIFTLQPPKNYENQPAVEIQLALRLPSRSKPLHITHIKSFLDAIRYQEPLYIGSKRYFFTLASFDSTSAQILEMIIDTARYTDVKSERQFRVVYVDADAFGSILTVSFNSAEEKLSSLTSVQDRDIETFSMPCLYCVVIEDPLKCARSPAALRFELNYLEVHSPKILLNSKIVLYNKTTITCEEAVLFESAKPGMIYQNTYYRFHANIRRKHLRHLSNIRDMTIPEPLFGTFVENSLGELMRYAEVTNREIIERFITLPFVEHVGAECDIDYLNGEFEASLYFVYGNLKVPAASFLLTVDQVSTFVTPQGIIARNLTEEQSIIDNLFQDFIYDPVQGVYGSKNERKIVEFMTEIIPAYQNRVKFNCPENLLEQFVYDESTFTLNLRETARVDLYEVEIKVEGDLNGTTLDQLWDCISSKKAFLELSPKKLGRKKSSTHAQKPHRILVLDLDRLAPIVQILDEIGINQLDDHVESRPLWSLASLDPAQFAELPIHFTMTPRLKEIQKQMFGQIPHEAREVPAVIQAQLRNYQLDGVHWLDRLRSMHLNGILADDMGLGKTLQAIITLTQFHNDNPNFHSIVVCPTSLIYNWKEEFNKFNPQLKVLPIDGTPVQRKKLLGDIKQYNMIITSYTLLQKDVEFYKTVPFGYIILDEAQHIKNRGTRNAQSVKMIQASHRLILTGTPIENSLDELWSLFDFLMPGLLSSYDRFIEKYIRYPSQSGSKNLENLRRKVSPFILRRMKKDVLEDLPPVTEIVYHCPLSDIQQQLYRSYAASAREELSQLVKKEGFERVQIHVLATLTRLKQICCHPAIFAKETAEPGDSAKYDMLVELIHNLIEGGHKTVIFSQYTRMLNIIREDLIKQGIQFEYLDGSSKSRLSIVKKFNEDASIPIFLVSLKAGGSGLNLVGADTVIHYDMWWNPAVENQATDRVHRMGQKNSVSSYKLITLNTIEEKILELHNRKRGLVREVVSVDEDIMAKLTWEEVLELLQT